MKNLMNKILTLLYSHKVNELYYKTIWYAQGVNEFALFNADYYFDAYLNNEINCRVLFDLLRINFANVEQSYNGWAL